ncbi:MAG: TolC family protein [Pseudomonadota bacterium]
MRKIIALALALLLLALPLFQGAIASEMLTMEKALQAAMSENPSLAAASYATDAAFARPPQAATPPDPTFMVQFSQVPINTIDVDQGMITYMVQQQIPFPSKLVYGYKAEKRAAEAAISSEAMTAQELKRLVKLAYLDIWRLQEEERIERRTISIYRQNKGAAETAYASLKGSVADPVRAAVDLGDIEAHLALLEQDRIGALAKLSAMMNDTLDPETRVATPPSLPKALSVSALVEKAKAVRPEIGISEKMIESQSARVGLAKSQYAPDLTLRWGYDDRPNQQNAWTGRVMVSVPLFSLSKQRFGVRESNALLYRAKSLNEETVLMTKAEIKTSYARLNAAKKRVSIYSQQVVPRARTLLSSSEEAYRAGNGDFLSIVDSIRSLNNAELSLIRARTDAHKAYADLERAVGVTPAETRPEQGRREDS